MSRQKKPDFNLEQFQGAMMPYGPNYELYVPSDHVSQHTEGVELILGVGPTGVGKDTILGATPFPKVISDTTRGKRKNDGIMEQSGVEYNFRRRRRAVYRDIQERNYVQIAPGPTGELYGSRDSAYPAEGVAVMDVVAKAVPVMRALPFKSVQSMFFVASPQVYLGRLDGRGTMSLNDRKKRLTEADESLMFGLDDPDMHFVENVQGELEIAVAHVMDIADHGHYDEALELRARNVGHAMLMGIREELSLPKQLFLATK